MFAMTKDNFRGLKKFRKSYFKKFCTIHKKIPVLESLFNKVSFLMKLQGFKKSFFQRTPAVASEYCIY